MPRLSSEARAAAVWRTGEPFPAPPKYMSKDARQLWIEITAGRPPDYFCAATRSMLETFCCAGASQRALAAKMSRLDVQDQEYGRLLRLSAMLVTVQSTMAMRLRLCQSSRLRHDSGELTERSRTRSPLLGGMAN